MTATDAQVRIIMRERQKGRTQEQAEASANLRSRKTVAKYEQLGQLPSERQIPRQYQTRTDAFAEEWSAIEAMLADAPSLEAKALFGWLCEQHPGEYQEGQLRTFQRRVAQWRALHQEQVAVLEQLHRPGEVMQTDGVWLTDLRITLQGEPLPHLFIHSVLTYSNWEWGRVAQSESLNAVRAPAEGTACRARSSSWGPCRSTTRRTTAVPPHIIPAAMQNPQAAHAPIGSVQDVSRIPLLFLVLANVEAGFISHER